MRTTGAQIIREVAAKHDLRRCDLIYGSTRRELAWPRQEAMYEIFVQCPHLPLPAIGRLLGGMDHSTVRYGIKKHAERAGLPEPVFGPAAVRGMRALFEAYGEAMRRAA